MPSRRARSDKSKGSASGTQTSPRQAPWAVTAHPVRRSSSAGGVSWRSRIMEGTLSGGDAEILRLEHEILEQRLVLDVRLVLDRAPALALLLFHVGPVLRRSGELDVVGQHDGAGMQPSLLHDALQVGEVHALVVVDEEEVERALAEAELAAQPLDRGSAVPERADDDGETVVHAGVSPDAACDVGVCGEVLDRDEAGLGRHHPCDAQAAIAAVGPELEQQPWRGALDRAVEELALLVADVHHHAARDAEVVDHADRVIEIAGARGGEDVLGERLLAPVAHLPVARQATDAKEHPQHRPAQEGDPSAAYLGDAPHPVRILSRSVAA